jgi:hypothetical protein
MLTVSNNLKTPRFLFFLKKTKKDLQNSHRFFMVEDIRLDATILTRIILKGVVNFELKFFQLDSFLNLFEFLSSLRKIDKIMINSSKFYFMMYSQVVLIYFYLKFVSFSSSRLLSIALRAPLSTSLEV